LGWADQEGVNWLATEALEKEPLLVSSWPLLVVDGFDSFNGAQRAALQLLGDRLNELIITLPGLPATVRIAYRRFNRFLGRLQKDLPSAEVETITESHHLLKAFSHLEGQLFEPITTRIETHNRVSMMEITSPVDEAREALRWLKTKIERDGLKPSSCALIVPDMERYLPYLKSAAKEYGMLLKSSHGEPLSSSPAMAALLDMLELSLRGFPRRLTLETVRSPYFDLSPYGLSPMDAYRLEAVSQYGQVIEGMDQWREALESLSQVEDIPEDYDGESRDSELPRGETASHLLIGLQAFADRLTLSESRSMGDWVEWLEDLMEDFRFLEDRETARDEAAFLDLREILRVGRCPWRRESNRGTGVLHHLQRHTGGFSISRESELD
jgi:ATP-dependent helicase/DNAse subunit B